MLLHGSCVAPSVLHPSPLALMLGQCLQWFGHAAFSAQRRCQWVLPRVLAPPRVSHGSLLAIACSALWLSGIAYSRDWREVWPMRQLLAVPCSAWVPIRRAVDSNEVLLPWLVWSQCWERRSPLQPEPAIGLQQRGAVLLSAQRCWPCQAPRSLRLCQGPSMPVLGTFLHPNDKKKALFVVLVLFEDVHTLYVILTKTVYTKYFVS